MNRLRTHWEDKDLGILVGANALGKERLTYLAFADDLTLVAKSRQAIQAMLKDLQDELFKVGLQFNAAKCKAQCNKALQKASLPLHFNGTSIPMVPAFDGFTFLGTIFIMDGRTTAEVSHRCSLAWGKFHKTWPLLKYRAASALLRIQLLHATVGRCLLWGAESWTLTLKEMRSIRSLQRSMLRRMTAPPKHADEDWVPWVKRSTRHVEELRRRARVPCWVEEHLRSKWRWAGHVARMGRDRADRWTYKMTMWADSRTRPMRSRRGRFVRWADQLVKFSKDIPWWELAADSTKWKLSEGAFVTEMVRSL